jgi:hypothetical protein
VLAPLGADTRGSQFLEPDGSFPNHIPNPENKAAMDAAVKATLAAGAVPRSHGGRGCLLPHAAASAPLRGTEALALRSFGR